MFLDISAPTVVDTLGGGACSIRGIRIFWRFFFFSYSSTFALQSRFLILFCFIFPFLTGNNLVFSLILW